MRYENLLKKTIPRWNSKRYKILEGICYEKGLLPSVTCEICGTYLINPQSILIHQGGLCRSKIK